MIVMMQADATNEQIKNVFTTAIEHGLKPKTGSVESEKTKSNVAAIFLQDGNERASTLPETIFSLPGVASVQRVSHRLPIPNTIQLGPELFIGKGCPCALVVGPCTVDKHIYEIAEGIKALGLIAMRGGYRKPRTDPGSDRGPGDEGMFMFLDAAKVNGIQTVFTEVMESQHIAEIRDIKEKVGYHGTIVLWVGARTENTILLSALGAQREFPVMLKNSLGAEDAKNLTDKAKWVLTGWNKDGAPNDSSMRGNNKVIFCLRGTKRGAQSSHYRYDPNHHWVNDLRDMCDAPIAIDPSHSAGTMKDDLVIKNCRAALLHNPNLLMIEGGYPAKGFEGGFRGRCDVDQTIPRERLIEVKKMVDEHNSVLSA